MKLSDWISSEGLTLADFGEMVGVNHSTVSRWCSGEFFPRGERLVLIREVTRGKVSADDFMPEREDAA